MAGGLAGQLPAKKPRPAMAERVNEFLGPPRSTVTEGSLAPCSLQYSARMRSAYPSRFMSEVFIATFHPNVVPACTMESGARTLPPPALNTTCTPPALADA